MSAIRLPDLAARVRAATDFETNLVVLAGAGTGKTSLLVERALNAVGSGVATMEQIAAITFTEKAAGEMRERLAVGLERLRASGRGEIDADPADEAGRAYRHLSEKLAVPPAQIAERALAAMEALDRSTVTTIHGFCSELLRTHPFESGVEPDFAVDNGEHAEEQRRRMWDAFLAEELGPAAGRADLWRPLLGNPGLKTVGEIALALADFHLPRSLLDPPFGVPDVRELFAGEIARLRTSIDETLERQVGLARTPLRYLEGMRRVLAALSEDGIDGLREALRADEDLATRLKKNYPNVGDNVQGVSIDETKALIRDTRHLVRALTRVDDALIARLLEAVAPFAIAFRESFLRQGFLSFDALLGLTRDLLRDHPDARTALKRRFRMLLVDEFQDTDPVQYEIVLLLAEAPDESTTDAFTARLEPGRLFVVGDAKQSVYRFRGADYAAYRRATDRIVEAGGVQLDLLGNFRSTPGIIDPVNRLFDGDSVCWKSSDYQPDYTAIQAARPAADGPAVELWTIAPGENVRAQERREAEGRALASEIERRVEAGECAYRQITILFRAFTNISHYLRPLRERQIPFVIDGGKDFLVRPEVEQLMATLKTLAQPDDEAALLAFLRSPAGGVADTELAAFAAARGGWHWRNTEAARGGHFPTIVRCFKLLDDLSKEIGNLPADTAVRRVVERTAALPLGAAAYEGPQRVANLTKLAAAAANLAADGRLSLDEVVEALREGRLEEVKTDRPLADDAAEAVRITSIHRMKGLENDWVVLPDLARLQRGPQDADVFAGPVSIPGGRTTLAVRAKETINAASAWLDSENQRHEQAEETRLFYVALTRAKQRLILIAGPAARGAHWIEALGPWGYDLDDPPADGVTLADGLVVHRRPADLPQRKRTHKGREDDVMRAVAGYDEALTLLTRQARPPIARPSGLEEERVDDRAQSSTAIERDARSHNQGRAVGIVIHRLLQGWDGDDSAALRRRLATLCTEASTEQELDCERLEQESSALLERFLSSELAEHFRSIQRVGCETPILVRRDDGQLFRGSIDLLYRDSDERWVVADYKTDRDAEDAALRERYAGQLAVYAEALRKAFELDQPPRKELWLLRDGRRIELDTAGPEQASLPWE